VSTLKTVLVSKKNLKEALGKDYTKEKVDEIMRVRIVYKAFRHSIFAESTHSWCFFFLALYVKVSDTNKDGKISYAEFLAAFRNQTSRDIVFTLDSANVS
jgi:hypothetical protein